MLRKLVKSLGFKAHYIQIKRLLKYSRFNIFGNINQYFIKYPTLASNHGAREGVAVAEVAGVGLEKMTCIPGVPIGEGSPIDPTNKRSK